MGVLDDYRKQLSLDKMEENYELPTDAEVDESFDKEKYKEALDALRNDENDIEAKARRFEQEYPKISEEQLSEHGLIKDDTNVQLIVKRAYCPKCGKEIVSKTPVMFNPFTFEKICKYDCECGFKANLAYAYPRLVVVDENGEEVNVFTSR